MHDTNNKLIAFPVAQQSGLQQHRINKTYSTIYTGNPDIIYKSGYYKILQFNSSGSFIQPANSNNQYTMTVGTGGLANTLLKKNA